MKQLTAEKEVLSNTLTMEKEKLHALEAAMEELHRRGWTSANAFYRVIPRFIRNIVCCF